MGSAVIYALAFPNIINTWGYGFLAYFALVPLLILVKRRSIPSLFAWGFLYGFIQYAILNYWLSSFHPLAIFIVPIIYGTYFTFLLPLLGLALRALPKAAFLAQTIVWIAFEYFRIQGFLGYAYGIIGYTQYLYLPLVNLASFGGVWIVSILSFFPNAFFAHYISQFLTTKSVELRTMDSFKEKFLFSLRNIFNKEARIVGSVFLGVFLLSFIIGAALYSDYSHAPTRKLALIQQNTDPWIGGMETYQRSLDILKYQSDLALEENPDMVVWSETSFIPAIDYHLRYRENFRITQIVQELMDYLEKQEVPFVLGNGDGRKEVDEFGEFRRRDYNAVYVYSPNEEPEVYRKLHLVPFSEYFPYKKELPFLHEMLSNVRNHFWEKGEEYVIFEEAGFTFCTPICFEDSFGYLTRNFVNQGADVILNLTNDSWANSVAASMQHMAMAVFRATETKRSVVRSTNGGMSVVIDPNGQILVMNEPFTESFIVYDVPIYTDETTLYLALGDWLAYLCIGLFFLLWIILIIRTIVKKVKPSNSRF